MHAGALTCTKLLDRSSGDIDKEDSSSAYPVATATWRHIAEPIHQEQALSVVLKCVAHDSGSLWFRIQGHQPHCALHAFVDFSIRYHHEPHCAWHAFVDFSIRYHVMSTAIRAVSHATRR